MHEPSLRCFSCKNCEHAKWFIVSVFFIWQYWSVWVLVRNLKSNRVDPSISNYKQGLYIVGECSTFSRYRTILLKDALPTLINFHRRFYKLYHEKLRYRYVVTATLPNGKPTKFNGKQSWVCSLSPFPIQTTLVPCGKIYLK